jgi:hypothetical protein
MTLRQYLIEKQGAYLPFYFIMIQIPNPEPIEVTRTFNNADLVQRDWMGASLQLIKITLMDVDLYELVPQQHNGQQKIPVCIKR